MKQETITVQRTVPACFCFVLMVTFCATRSCLGMSVTLRWLVHACGYLLWKHSLVIAGCCCFFKASKEAAAGPGGLLHWAKHTRYTA
jgi:hypothetical protein